MKNKRGMKQVNITKQQKKPRKQKLPKYRIRYVSPLSPSIGPSLNTKLISPPLLRCQLSLLLKYYSEPKASGIELVKQEISGNCYTKGKLNIRKRLKAAARGAKDV